MEETLTRHVPVEGVRVRESSLGCHYQLFVSRNEFFNQELIVKIEDDKVRFQRPTMSYCGKTNKPSKQGMAYKLTCLITSLIPLGDYMFDKDESNEDVKVIYLEDLIPRCGYLQVEAVLEGNTILGSVTS
jgi:hypothetical protein